MHSINRHYGGSEGARERIPIYLYSNKLQEFRF